MNGKEILETRRPRKETLKERFGVERLALFGAFARNEGTENSFVEILVKLNSAATSKTYFGVQFYIEDLLGRNVLLFTDKALESEFRPLVEREALYV